MINFFDRKSFLKKLAMALLVSSPLKSVGIGYHELIPSFLPQHTLDKSSTKELLELVQKENLRSENVYSQFQTLALFDFLRYSTATVGAAAQIKADKYGIKASLATKELISSEVEKTSKELIFLVQADIRQAIEPDLTKAACPWTFSLLTSDGQTFKPSIEKIKHSQITKTLFGEAYSKFKTLYKLSFGLPCDSIKHQALRQDTLKLICRSSQNEFTITWNPEK